MFHKIRIITIFAPMIYAGPCMMFWMRAYPLLWQVGRGWALEFESFLGPVKWHTSRQASAIWGPKNCTQDNKRSRLWKSCTARLWLAGVHFSLFRIHLSNPRRPVHCSSIPDVVTTALYRIRYRIHCAQFLMSGSTKAGPLPLTFVLTSWVSNSLDTRVQFREY